MDIKLKRTIILTAKNLFMVLLAGAMIFGYMFVSLMLSQKYTGDLYFGFAAISLPFVIYTVWDYSKNRVEHELEREQDLIRTLSKKQEGGLVQKDEFYQ
jgi:hypothetical protein